MPSTPSRKEQSHERIVEVAARAIRRAGYQGVGVADIMKEAGLTHGGFYAHFASRDELLVEAMQRAGQDSGAALAEALAQGAAEGRARFEALVLSYLADAQLDNTECGCLVAALSSEMPRQADAVHAQARRSVRGLVDAVRASLPPADAAQAEVVTATMVGALQLARTLGGDDGLAVLARARQALLAAHPPQATPSARPPRSRSTSTRST